MGFLSQEAQAGQSNGRTPYAIEEDRLIVAGLEEGKPASKIAEVLVEAGHARTVLSVRYRVNVLREKSAEFDTLEAFYAAGVKEKKGE